MKKETTYASTADVLSAMELVREGSEIKGNTRFLTLYNAASLVNMGIIEDTDYVLLMSSGIAEITWIISYLYNPQKLVLQNLNEIEEDSIWFHKFKLMQSEINQLLVGYPNTEPTIFASREINNQFKSLVYDVIFVDFYASLKTSNDVSMNRFDIEAGEEYETYEKTIISTKGILRKKGRVLTLCKPSWILKSWKLLQELGLQLEYQNYSLYLDHIRQPNGYLWLRCIKEGEDFNIDKQKRNLLALMKDNNIDRLYAHKNNLIFPYVELSYKKNESYVQLDQDLQHMQYFFSLETTKKLTKLCTGYTACLVTPSIARYAHEHNKNVVLFERDNRFRRKKGVRFVKYDLNTGLTKFTHRKYANKFDVVICDPPFNIKLDTLAKDIIELLKNNNNSIAYVVFPKKDSASLINALSSVGLMLCKINDNVDIEYARPPKLVRVHGKQAIQLYKFTF